MATTRKEEEGKAMQIKNSFRRQIAREPGPSMTHHSNLYEFWPGAIVATVIYPEKGRQVAYFITEQLASMEITAKPGSKANRQIDIF